LSLPFPPPAPLFLVYFDVVVSDGFEELYRRLELKVELQFIKYFEPQFLNGGCLEEFVIVLGHVKMLKFLFVVSHVQVESGVVVHIEHLKFAVLIFSNLVEVHLLGIAYQVYTDFQPVDVFHK